LYGFCGLVSSQKTGLALAFYFYSSNRNSGKAFAGLSKKTNSNKLAKLLGNFVSLAKFPLHLANMPSPPSLGITSISICQLVLPTCWRLNFMILAKILGCQILLPSPNSKLVGEDFFFT